MEQFTCQYHSSCAVDLMQHSRYLHRLIFQPMSFITDHYVEMNIFQLFEMLGKHFVRYEQERDMLSVGEILRFMLRIYLKRERS